MSSSCSVNRIRRVYDINMFALRALPWVRFYVGHTSLSAIVSYPNTVNNRDFHRDVTKTVLSKRGRRVSKMRGKISDLSLFSFF